MASTNLTKTDYGDYGGSTTRNTRTRRKTKKRVAAKVRTDCARRMRGRGILKFK